MAEKPDVVVDKTGPMSYFQPESIMMGNVLNNLPQRAMRHRPPGVLPEIGNAAPDLDQLDDVSCYYYYLIVQN